ncbi:multicopper oxidase family protein [Nonomuraea sp. CA-141351]|uniref:multicopper oxidase family protein n=1 Tax=Nonomuraea sp. CA-141351 TaxID=3239996 RepID=UPI003D922DD1
MEIMLIVGYAVGAALIVAYVVAARARSSRLVRGALVAASALALIRIGSAGYLWSINWGAAADVVMVALPPLVAAVLLAPPWTGVARWRLRTAVLAAVLHAYATFVPQAPPYLITVEVMAVVLLAGGVLARWWERRFAGQPRRGSRTAVIVSAIVLLVASGTAAAWATSRLPERASMMDHDNLDYGGRSEMAAHAAMGIRHTADPEIDISTLTGPQGGEPDRRVTLTAETAKVKLPSGETVNAWTFNGTLPGPELRFKQGELVEVTLINKDIADGVTLHWHGLDVPNAEDGVAGLTQNSVAPGQKYVYRFVPQQVGTFWYHSHQQSDSHVKRGLFGALVIDPADKPAAGVDVAAVAHAYPVGDARTTAFSLGGATPSSRVSRKAVAPGTQVRLRLINADNEARGYALSGTPFRVSAIDGTDLSGPSDITGKSLFVAGGGRYDLTFTMPNGPVQLTITEDENGNGSPAVLLSPDGAGEVRPITPGPTLDPTGYGTPTKTPFGAASHFDRQFTMLLSQGFGFYDGQIMLKRTINGTVFPSVPSLVVRKGDLVKVTFLNRSFSQHPMHLHGHHMLVLSRNGTPSTGSPWWTDTLQVSPGERYEVAFRADNPGLWMDHCHNLEHAAQGMTMHLMYEGYTTPYQVGSATGNNPE